ncbi:Guanidinopropionase [Methylobacterium crusticola]|uniref:Guanidinopropionase n=1 Tax=Methylobacterium crusticola TaxID=1697972 RepID=A0ABQ4QVQ6_9HYPH|nr:arginase family protein [Methylobacterium crusticola]GJD49426.1 Guanidinopropionase [Methylobacterium crusticola]
MPDEPAPQTFARLPSARLDDLRAAKVAIIGAANGSPYEAGRESHAAAAPAALRAASAAFTLRHFDFDLDGPLLDAEGEGSGIVDCGDVPTDPADPAGNRARISDAVRTILAAGAAPLVLGGDDSVPIPVLQAFESQGPITILQIDAHVDWGDVIQGNGLGYGSPMRRASEMPWVSGMVQVGIRGLGSGTPDQIADARAWGSRIVTMRDFRRMGIEGALALVPAGGDVFVTIDVDGFDLAIMPAVNAPTPGGLFYQDVIELIHGVSDRARICGCSLVELVPEKDPGGLSALTAARVACTVAALMRVL